MLDMVKEDVEALMLEIGARARAASQPLSIASAERKHAALVFAGNVRLTPPGIARRGIQLIPPFGERSGENETTGGQLHIVIAGKAHNRLESRASSASVCIQGLRLLVEHQSAAGYAGGCGRAVYEIRGCDPRLRQITTELCRLQHDLVHTRVEIGNIVYPAEMDGDLVRTAA